MLARRLVVTTTPASPPYSALYEFESTLISDTASRPGAELPTVPKMAFVDAWPSWMYDTPYVLAPRNWMSSLPPTTLGLRSRNDWISRLLRGRSWSCCSSRPREMAWLSSVMLLIASADTVTVSLMPPTVRVTSTRAVPAARTSTPVLSNFLKFVVTT